MDDPKSANEVRMDMELVTQASFSSLQKEDDGRIISSDSFDEWTWSGLRKQFRYKNLEKLYTIYHRRIQYGYLSIFILLQLLLGFAYCLSLIITVGMRECLLEIVVYCIVGALMCPMIALSFRSRHIAKNTYLPIMLSWMIIVLLVVCDLTIPLFYVFTYAEDIPPIRPAYATHSLLACYVFLPITKNSHALVLGLTASMCYLATLSIITYNNTSDYITKIVSDAIYFMCVNALGLYFRFMNEVVIRRSFLDRRKCVESTLRLNYEKDQENSENSLNTISPDTPTLSYSMSNKHYVKFNNGRSNTIISTNSRTRLMVNNQADVFASTYRRRTHFMDSCLRDYHLMLKAADAEMENAINQMPLSKWEQWSNWKHINPLFLTFRQWSWEIPFLREPDPVFKFYIGCSAFVLIFMGFMYLVPTFMQLQWHLRTLVGYFSVLMFLFALMPLTWMHFIWNRCKDPHDEHEGHVPHPRNKLLYFFYQTSVKVVWSALLRTILYLVITIMLAACAMLDMIFECKNHHEDNLLDANVTSSVSEVSSKFDCIVTPWQMTETCSLAILTSFLFLRVHYILKFVISICVVAFYAWNVWVHRSNIFELSDTWNPNMEPRLAHILSVLFLTFSLHLIDRQAEYLSRLDYQWKRQLTKEQDEAFHTRNANKLLLRNILPEHVAEFYLNMNRTEENEPYHEAHNNVAVMFASLTELSILESNILSDLNEIICEFDKLLFEPSFMCRIEKIKVAGTTYMAACGLEAHRRGSMHSTESDENCSDNVVKVMAQFAVQMMSVLDKMNARSFTTSKPHKLRIGISHGEVTAGVVGAQKPLYDIWGDAVNMASRMDTTGLPGKIQVTADTAAVLEQQGVKCHLRGETYVKPKGEVTTYFVGIDEKGMLERVDAREESTSL
ncbi:PREDICTED: adenylate cyclase type 4-like isoform X3 [Trachymyrmex septentrionalis]|uniref:adenylate cyclase type 4-like isoform X3 n=1 Tax=Trachymyrmex septentrionalis TaxID=34720 RepID=UPI00084F22A0|nr:PREDICTED: adenylate cyclase type 4-like isoform X3 [Trachymyrmex septentrionalis]